MAHIAASKLMTSKGNVLSGEELPNDLPADEVKAIGEAGGILDWKASGKAANEGGRKATGKAAEKRAAENAVKDAEALVANASTDADRETAQKLLDDATAELAAFG